MVTREEAIRELRRREAVAELERRGVSIEQPIQQKTTSDSLSGDIVKRALIAQDIKQRYTSGETSLPSAALQGIGNVGFGLMQDIGSRVLSSVTPDIVKEKLKSGLSSVERGTETISPYIPGLQSYQQAIEQTTQQYPEFKKQYPDLTGNIEAVANIATGLPVGMLEAAGTKIGLKAGKTISKGTGKLAGRGLQETAGYIGSKVLPKATDEMADVARLAQRYNIPVTATEILESPALTSIQKISPKLIGSGESAYRNNQMKAFNKALLNTVGIEADKFSPAIMDKAFINVGRKFDKFAKGKTYTFDDDTIRQLNSLREEIGSAYGSDVADSFMNEANKILNKVDNMRNMKGEILNSERSRINALSRKAEPMRADAYKDLEDFIIEKMTSGDADLTKEIQKAKQDYKNLIVIEPLAPKAKGGNINPTLLADRVNKIYGRQYVRGKAGEIGDLARIGKELLPIPGGSDTAEKLFYGGATLGFGGYNPALVATGLAGNRAYQTLINRNPTLVRRLIERSK